MKDETDLAKNAGAQYAEEQIQSSFFHDWVWQELVNGSKLPADQIAPGLETSNLAKGGAPALRLAKNVLQQVRWDTERDLDRSTIEDCLRDAGVDTMDREATQYFWLGFRDALESKSFREWVASELIAPLAKKLARGRRR